MRFVKTASCDESLVDSFQKYLTASSAEESPKTNADKMKQAVLLLSEACSLIQDIDGCGSACKKINRTIAKIGKCADKLNISIETNSSNKIEKDVQKDIENNSK